MAVTAAALTDGTSTGNPADTAAVAPVTNRLILAAVIVANSNVGLPGAASVALSGLGLTWVQVGEQSYAQRRRLFLFRALGTPSSGAVTITYTPGANTFQEMQWALAELAGVDTTGTDGSGAVGTPGAAETGFGTTLTVTIPGTPAEGDATYATFGKEGGGDVPTLEAGWVQLSTRESANVRHLVTGWDADQDQSATLNWTSGSGAGGMGVLVIAGEAGGAVALAPAALTLTAVPLGPQPGPVTVQLAPAQLDLAAQPVSPQAGAGMVLLAAAVLTLGAQQLDPAPGAVAVQLVAASLGLAAVPLSQPAVESVDVTVVVGPTRVTSPLVGAARLLPPAAVAATRGGWQVGGTRDGWTVADTRA